MSKISEPTSEELTIDFLQNPGAPESPQALMGVVRDRAPVIGVTGGSFLVSGYEEAQAAYRDRRCSSGAAMEREASFYRLYARTEEEAAATEALFGSMMMTSDEPRHSRLRNVVREVFSIRSVRGWQPTVERVVSELISEVKDKPTFDVGRMLGYPLTERVICDIMGVPVEDHVQWEKWARVISDFNRTRIPEEGETRALMEAAVNFTRYWKDRIAERRIQRGEDLVSLILEANSAKVVSDEELVGMFVIIITAGHDTTANMVVNGLLTLLSHPDQYALLREQPDLVPSAVDEMLRFEPSAPFPFPRVVLEDTQLGGVEVPAGATVFIADHLAGRDPRIYTDPETFNVRRFGDKDVPPHISFGFGIHRCLGHFLARAELETMFGAIVTELPELEIIERSEWTHGFFRHMPRLVVGVKGAPGTGAR